MVAVNETRGASNRSAADRSDSDTNNLLAPEHVDNLLWQLSSPDERRTLLANQNNSDTVQDNDTLSSLAAEYGTSLQDLIAANSHISNPNLIFSGQVINIPPAAANFATAAGTPAPATAGLAAVSTSTAVDPSQLRTSDAGLEFITGHEGLRTELYNDPAGHATIGVGHLVHLGPIDGRASEAPFANGISRAEAMDLLRQDVRTAESAVQRLVNVPLNQNQFDALVSFTFNLGEGNLASSTLLSKLNLGDYASVPSELNRWTRGGGQVLPGLVRRRADEGQLFNTPVGETPEVPPPTDTTPTEVLRNGSRGANVSTLQQLLTDAGFSPGPVDGSFGDQTDAAVRSFQSANNLTVDGIVGQQTWEVLTNSEPPIVPPVETPQVSSADAVIRNGARSEGVQVLQQQLAAAGFDPGPADGVFGDQTESAVREFQISRNLTDDGIVGSETWDALGVDVGTAPPPSNTTVTTGPEGSAAALWVKPGANITTLSPEIQATFDDVVQVWANNGGPTPVITSGNDSVHGRNSLHFENHAIDLRAKDITDSKAAAIAADLQAQLGSDYDVIFERFPNNPDNDHIHIEYDPD